MQFIYKFYVFDWMEYIKKNGKKIKIISLIESLNKIKINLYKINIKILILN